MILTYLHTKEEMIEGCSTSYDYQQICHIENGDIIAAIEKDGNIIINEDIVNYAKLVDDKLIVTLLTEKTL